MSVFLDKTFDEWLSRLTREQKQEFVNTVFDTLEATGARSFSELYSNKRESLSAIVKAARRLPADQVSTVISVIKTFLDAGKDVWLGDQKPKLEKSKEDKLTVEVNNDKNE
jgi:ATP-dependent DNA ligase